MKNLLVLLTLFGIFFVSGCSNPSRDTYIKNEIEIKEVDINDKEIKKSVNYVNIKYRDTLVDVSEFESFDTSKSSFIEKAFYDEDNQYLILNLSGTYYHWCGVPRYIWEEFKESDSLGKYYNQYIKGEYDCRINYLPIYN